MPKVTNEFVLYFYLKFSLAEADCRPLGRMAEELEVKVGYSKIAAGLQVLPASRRFNLFGYKNNFSE
jgi:hypothetical protein